MLTAKPLTYESFLEYGTFAALAPPTTRPLVKGGMFWPDLLSINSTQGSLTVGVTQARWRPLEISVCEYHTATSEGILPLDGDVFMHVAPATRDDVVPQHELEVFRVPLETMVILNPGVWHHAPFPAQENSVVNVQIILPPRTYANDCIVRTLVEAVPFRPGV